jgi:hypothetical protein
MRLASAIIFCALCCTFIPAAAQQKAIQQKAVKLSAMQSGADDSNQSDARELRKDLERMRVIVQQMETNLAFVDTTQSPLKHQFELEIAMWKTVIARMERRLNESNGH